jgi:hypothetical protein
LKNPHAAVDQNFFTPGVTQPHGIGVTGNKMNIVKGDIHKLSLAQGEPKKKIKNKGFSKTGNFIHHLRNN